MKGPLVVAHRGGGALAPENTLAAFRNAVRLGSDAVELDVLVTRDGHLVAHHDDSLARTAGAAHHVWDLDLADLKTFDVGRWFGPEFAGERVPTLDEVAAALPSTTRLVADFKHGEERFPGLAERVAGFARAFGPARFAALSIRHEVPAAVARLAPGILPLFTYRTPLPTDAELRKLAELSPSVGLATSQRALSAALLVVARGGNRPVYLFTPNTPAELAVALTVGVDGVITDDPDTALALRRQLSPS
jgi:glycerophosphoryl diester phosphodiesterase